MGDRAKPVALRAELAETLMWENAGPFRTGEKLAAALVRIRADAERMIWPNVAIAGESLYNLDLQDWFELRAMLTTAETVVRSALARNESRGAHQREDFPYSHESLAQEPNDGIAQRGAGVSLDRAGSNCIAATKTMADRSTKKAVLRVRRGTVNEESRYDDFEVPFEEGMSVLDALRWIRINLDSSLAIRYSCINANACKTCMALVNGEVEYTCIAKLTPEIITVEPLPKRPLIRDLVTDTVPEEEKL